MVAGFIETILFSNTLVRDREEIVWLSDGVCGWGARGGEGKVHGVCPLTMSQVCRVACTTLLALTVVHVHVCCAHKERTTTAGPVMDNTQEPCDVPPDVSNVYFDNICCDR